MLHIVKLIERNHPERAPRIITGLVLVSASLLAVGSGIFLLN